MNAFWKGFISLFDWFPQKEFKLGSLQDDCEAIKSDWEKVIGSFPKEDE